MDKSEVMAYLGVSKKTVERYVKEGRLKVVYVANKGIYDRGEVEALKQERETPVHRTVVDDTGSQLATTPFVSDEVLALLSAIAISNQRQSLQHKLLLTLKEAAQVSGVSAWQLRQAIAQGKLQAARVGRAWKVRLLDLEKYVNSLFS